MHVRLNPQAAELLAKGFSALSLAAGVGGFFGIDGPVKWGFGIAALVIAYWSWRRKLPTVQELLLCFFIAVSVVFAIAWYERRSSEDRYDFVVTPYKKDVATESAFPGPEHEVLNSGLYGYGEHVHVECVTEGEEGSSWYGLPNGNYIRASDLSPSPRTDAMPPPCD